MSRADQLVDRGADRLRDLSDRAAEGDGVTTNLAEPLAEDSAFLRKLKPSAIAARAKGDAPTAGRPAQASRPQPSRKRSRRRGGGPNPFVVAGAAFAAGVLLAKWLDWRGHAHPRG